MQSENSGENQVVPVDENGKVQVTKPKKRWTTMMFVEAFYAHTLGRKRQQGNFQVQGRDGGLQLLTYHATGEGYGNRWDNATQTRIAEVMTENIAVKLPDGLVISNANRLRYCGSHMAWGRRCPVGWGSAQTPTQATLEKLGAIPVPFSVFEQAQLDIRDVRIIEKAKSETVRISREEVERSGKRVKKIEKRHYVGASLMSVGDSCFLFDIDREELKHKLFNPFVVKLPREAKTIKEAYDILIPDAVRKAIKTGRRWERQGEWFFVYRYKNLPALPKVPAELAALAKNPPHVKDFGGTPTEGYEAGMNYRHSFDGTDEERRANQDKYRDAVTKHREVEQKVRDFAPHEGQLMQGDSRPNTVGGYIKIGEAVLVSGKISHTGREHRDLFLKDGWYEAIPNTAVGSWQVSGEID